MIEMLLFVLGLVVFFRCGKLAVKVVNRFFSVIEDKVCGQKRD